MEIVELVGIVVGVIFVMNLILIMVFKMLILLKGCNMIVFGFYF